MKRGFALVVGSLLCLIHIGAQDMRTLLVAMPDSILPLLTKNNRMDCVDFVDSKMKAEVKNRLGEVSELKVLTKDYLLLQMTSQSTVEMKLLSVNDSAKVVCVVRTVCAPVCDSAVEFYDISWKRLKTADYIACPPVDSFFRNPAQTDLPYQLLREKADVDLIKASLSVERAVIRFEYTTPDYLSEDDREKIRPYLRKDPLVYSWTEGKFTPSEAG
ncbi:PF11644 family protein [Bacteroidetes bacterium oral taxon 272 str. F0290]|uniref:DUF3256 family protein n=1 Tax=Phocaeicola abscessus TaxID=555313 RepID=UPI000385E6E3|nr:DUF3256 family protein [Phocaeicola abscessus]EPT32976.1 PF11644 family protein [Bacteroidetes bacterium oral taxon 272 str. F0290]